MPNQMSFLNQPAPKKAKRTNKGTIPHRLYEDITAAFQTLGIVLAPGALDAALSVAERESLGHPEFFYRLLAGPVEARTTLDSNAGWTRHDSAS